MPTEKAMNVLELLDAGERNFTKIASRVGLSRERVRQIASTIGIRPEQYRRPVLQRTCFTCQTTFPTKRENARFCTRQCSLDYKFLRETKVRCKSCSTTENLVKAGKIRFHQTYSCRPCVKKRTEKYGFYQKKNDPEWVAHRREYSRRYYQKKKARLGDKSK